MADSLSRLLAKHDHVTRAFLALMHDATEDSRPHLIVGIEGRGDMEQVMREAGNVVADTSPNGEPVDLYRVFPDDPGVSRYFIQETKPFYCRS